MPGAIGWYDENAVAIADSYEALKPEQLHGWMEGLYPPAPGLILDMGAGSERDAAWLAGLGHGVVAAEPAPALRAEAVPRTLWQAMRRFAAWVEPALIAEWIRLMHGYAAGQNRILDEGATGFWTRARWQPP